jgi:hypothetical protein
MIEAMITCPTTGQPACGGDHIVDDSTVKVFPKEP